MSKFGWWYPPGCSGPPDPPEPHPKSEEMYELLEAVGVDEAVIQKACAIVKELACLAEMECPRCLAESERQMAEADKLFDLDDTESNGGG